MRKGGVKSINRWNKAAAARPIPLSFPPSLLPSLFRYLDGGVDGSAFRVSPEVSASTVNFGQFPVTAHKRLRAHGLVGLRDGLEGGGEAGKAGKPCEKLVGRRKEKTHTRPFVFPFFLPSLPPSLALLE